MLTTTQKQELQNLFGEDCAFNLPLSQFTSMHVGGPADVLCWPKDQESLSKAIIWARTNSLPILVLGKGSNTLVKDGGFRGMVLNLTKGFRHFKTCKENDQHVWVEAEGGVPTQQFVRWCIEQGFAGAERLAGVPGTIGGNIFMNAGTYLGEIGDIVEEVKICDAKGKITVYPAAKLEFTYRKTSLPPSSAVISAVMKLQKGEKEKLEKEVREVFEKRGFAQPIDLPSLGSVFKNPSVGKQASKDPALPGRARGVRGDGARVDPERAKRVEGEMGQRSPRYQQRKAWELVVDAGCKGVRVGGARVSEKHANFIVNEGNATAKDVLILIGLIKDKVKEATGIILETEIKVVGEEK